MQGAVPRDAQGRSDFGMSAVNPSSVRRDGSFGEGQLRSLVQEIAQRSGRLLEIVNLNVANQQYIVAGDLWNLQALNLALRQVRQTRGVDPAQAATQSLAMVETQRQSSPDGRIELRRDLAIPLAGIDVPFHSTQLRDGVPAFRAVLEARIPEGIPVERLIGRYIPNLTARPFSMERSYVQEVYDLTQSPVLGEILAAWESANQNPQALGRWLLIELLAYQFASPVRWIETQNHLFSSGTSRFVEFGPSPILGAMAERTIRSGNLPRSQPRQILSSASHRGELYFEAQDRGPSAADFAQSRQGDASPSVESAPPPPASVARAPEIARPPAPVTASRAATPIADQPLGALDALQAMLAVKLRRPIAEIRPEQSIRDLVAGKSALGNEIVGDLGREFGSGPDNAPELPLRDLASRLGGSYRKLGPVLQGQVARLVSGKMPAGFGMAQVRQFLATERGLGEGRIDAVLLHALTLEPPSRLSNPPEAQDWLNRVVDSYGERIGQAIPRGTVSAESAPVLAVAGPVAAVTPVADQAVSAVQALRSLLSVRLQRPLSEIPETATIASLINGRSALGNEIMGDIGRELGQTGDNAAAELSLRDLAARLGGAYRGLGSVTNGLIGRLVSGKMPAGFGLPQIRAHLQGERTLGEGRIQAVLLHALTMEPRARLASPAEAAAWLDAVVDSYGQANGVTVPRASTGGASSAARPSAGVDPRAVRALRADQERMIRDLVRSYQEFLGDDPRAAENARQMEAELRGQAEAEGAAWAQEHGEDYANGIRPIFDSRRYREYNSAWNWGRQEAVRLFFDLANGRVAQGDAETARRAQSILRRSTPQLVQLLRHYTATARQEGHASLGDFYQNLAQEAEGRLRRAPSYRLSEGLTQPVMELGEDGGMRVREAPRESLAGNPVRYVQEMEQGGTFPVPALPEGPARETMERLLRGQRELVIQLREQGADARILTEEQGRLAEMESRVSGRRRMPYLSLSSQDPSDPNARRFDSQATEALFGTMREMAAQGMDLQGRNYLVTGAGPGSIGAEMVQALLQSGARVIVTTSGFSPSRTSFFQRMYQEHGASGSELVVLPFNQGSAQDVRSLVHHIYSPEGLGLDLDGVIPFAGISEQGMDVGNLGSRSELAHRIMLTNTLRLIGEVRNQKERNGNTTRPAQVLLPLSPNHGLLGHDGLYSESKLGLESLLHRARSEGWDRYLTVSGAVIGWTRGTNLMEGNDLIAPGVEELGVRTFSQPEMAFNLMSLLHPRMRALAERDPVWADFNGGFQRITDLNLATSEIRESLRGESRLRRAVYDDARADLPEAPSAPSGARRVEPRANFDFNFPELPSADRLGDLSHLRGMVDPSQVVVVTGMGEIGPWGNHRTRWEMEANGEFSIEGTIEMARIMGLIRYHDGPLGDRRHYSGWVDAASNEPVADGQMIERYNSAILEHSGIRVVEPALADGYDPERTTFYREVVLTSDMPAFEVASREDAESFVRAHGVERTHIFERSGTWYVQLRSGAVLRVPRAFRMDRFVAGQIPTGWDPRRYGIPQDIVNQVDPTTLYALVSTAEALVASGITDPYELYQYVHVSEVANTLGGGMGGMTAIRGGFFNRSMELPVQGGSSNLQEQLINVVPAWVNMLFLSSSGPIRTPVGACATAATSLDLGVDSILSGRARVAIVGGFDDFSREGAYEFAQMQATSNSAEETVRGRDPREQSRPASSSRAGFMEAQGGGVQVLMRGDLALAMGAPILGIVALTNTASDEQGSSVPAPGQGILAAGAREVSGAHRGHLMLNLEYRRRGLARALTEVQTWRETELTALHGGTVDADSVEGSVQESEPLRLQDETFLAERRAAVERQADRMMRSAYATWNHRFWEGDPTVSPLRGALAVFGLTPDDIEISSFHGTSTTANDNNESAVNQAQMAHLVRSPGNPLFTIWQKGLTGHPKGGAAAWMLNGLLQAMNSGVVPGHRSLDNVDPHFEAYDHLLYSNDPIHVGRRLRAGILKSFGFGQAGAEALVISPDYFFASLETEAMNGYSERRSNRQHLRYRREQDALTGRGALIEPRTQAPYSPAQRQSVYLDPTARAAFDPARGSWYFPSRNGTQSSEAGEAVSAASATEPNPAAGRFGPPPAISMEQRLAVAARQGIVAGRGNGIGVDTEDISEWQERIHNETFLARNFSSEEIAYCRAQPNPAASFAARWSAKEAVLKAISNAAPEVPNLWGAATEAMAAIEILPSPSGSPVVRLYGSAERVAQRLGIREIRVTITHGGTQAIATATARRSP